MNHPNTEKARRGESKRQRKRGRRKRNLSSASAADNTDLLSALGGEGEVAKDGRMFRAVADGDILEGDHALGGPGGRRTVV